MVGTAMDKQQIIIFDGVCNFCNGAVNLIIKRDPRCLFVFTPMQSDVARKLITEHQVDSVGADALLLIKNGQCFVATNAVLEIAGDLTGGWPLLRVFKVVPRILRDALYRVFARNRYRLFGRRPACMVPAEDVRNRFVSV
jgi:predicted DCC family thiol-disulfide oxidoreductase YuxK